MKYELYKNQILRWPEKGQHVLANFDDESISVYQAYKPAIAKFAVDHQCFGGEFSFTRMSWIKPNFLWMMFRSGWAIKEGQERILEVRIKRDFFDQLMKGAVPSVFIAEVFTDHQEWKDAVSRSDVRLQWDPDHDPAGKSVERRAVQLGLRGNMLQRYSDELCWIKDITDFVIEQRSNVNDPEKLLLPYEDVYVAR
jgi:Domain of unknown function (DUF4291)